MNIDDYLARIGFEGTPRADLPTLFEIHRRHLLAIPYENIDVQLGRPVDLDISRIYRKLVEQRRGGWCYEMNGLLGWALGEIGFDVKRVTGGVMRVVRGDDALGNHLVLTVDLDGELWVADAGFGDGVLEPLRLTAGPIEQRGFEYRLERLPDGLWRFHNHAFGGAPSFDFSTAPADESLLLEKCNYLQTSPESPFVLSLVCQRFVPGGYEIQLGKLAKRVTPAGPETWLLRSPAELVSRLESVFGLNVPEVAGLWPRIVERHDEVMARRG
ncbi:MAG: arylamine N-acetyltransferase [Pseudomonadales bacterium]|nr:arylamine N-acetyltransferase [Pseudomonadales bacterium]